MGVNRPSRRIVVIPPNIVQQAVTTQGFTGVAEEVLEQIKFLGRKGDGLSLPHDSITSQVDLNVVEGIALLLLG